MSCFFKCAGILLVSFLAAAPAFGENETDWSFDPSASDGPSHWATLDPAFKACGGEQQSPVDLNSASAISADMPSLFADLQQFQPIVVNDGHKIKVLSKGNGGSITYQGETYKFDELHFHHTSDHRIDDRTYPLEAHFVLVSDQGDMLVLGVMFLEGAASPVLETILDNAPASKGRTEVAQFIDPKELLPIDRRFFHYRGSLTTPPCSENVTWHIYKEALSASPEQIEKLDHLYSSNHRPLQPLNRRYILQGE